MTITTAARSLAVAVVIAILATGCNHQAAQTDDNSSGQGCYEKAVEAGVTDPRAFCDH
jgi:hypothetical protein